MRKRFGLIFDEVAKDGLFIIAYDEDFVDLGDFGDGLEAVLYDWVSGDFE